MGDYFYVGFISAFDTGSLIGTSPILGYGSPWCIVALPTDCLSDSALIAMPDTPPGAGAVVWTGS